MSLSILIHNFPGMLACEYRDVRLQFYLFLLRTYDCGFMNVDYEHVWVLGLGSRFNFQ
jgi:hypothetical protein